MIWNLASLLTALFGGVVAVFIGQILKTYREDIGAARNLRSQLNYLKSLQSNDSERERSNHREIQNARNDAEKIYRENFWLLTDDGQEALYNIFYQTTVILEREENDPLNEMEWRKIEELYNEIDQDMAHVTLLRATFRYLGKQNPYLNHSKVE